MNSEQYYIERDAFIQYILTVVNPARVRNQLSEIREHEARECYRIIHEMQQGTLVTPAAKPAPAGPVQQEIKLL